MPQPTNKSSSDYYLYKYLYNPIAKKICFIHPNIITILGALLTIPIFYNYYNNQSMIIYITLIIFRAIFDSLDGAVARNCNSGSKIGALLDIFSDTLCISTIGILFLYRLYQIKDDNKYNKYILIISGITIFYMMESTIEELIGIRNPETMFKYNFGGFELDRFIHDNVSLATIIIYYLMKNYV